MRSLRSNKTVRQFVKFAIVGASSTFLDWGLHVVLYKGFHGALAQPVRLWWLEHFPSVASNPEFDGAFTTFKAISFLAATINGFIFNRLWTFRIKEKAEQTRQFFKFLAVTGTGLVINTLIASQIHKPHGGSLNYILSLGIATFITMFWNFAGHKLWTFRAKADAGNV